MKHRPILHTERLVLRPFSAGDAPEVCRLAGDYEIASTTLNIPYPYELAMAEQWIAQQKEGFREGTLVNFAVTRKDDGKLIGCIGLKISLRHNHGELGYWIGREYWGNGYCTEAGREVVRYGFEELHLQRVHAYHLARNPASGRVLEKIGMVREGVQRQHVRKWDVYEDLVLYGIVSGGERLTR